MLNEKNSNIIIIIIAFIINITLAIIKQYVGLITNSIAIITDSYNNFGDGLVCFITIFAFIFLYKKSNHKYPYGYGRIEYLSTYSVALLTCFIGAYLAYISLERIFYPRPIFFSIGHFFIILATIFVKVFLLLLYLNHNRKRKSAIYYALILDTYVDIAITSMTLISFMLLKYSGLRIDGILGMIIAIIIAISAIKLTIFAIKKLIGIKIDDDVYEVIRKIVYTYDNTLIDSFSLHDYGKNSIYGNIVVSTNKDVKIIEDDLRNKTSYDITVLKRG